MRLDDHTMTILTGLVFAVVLGTVVQKSDTVTSLFSSETAVAVEDDYFIVRAGTVPTLDVLANDVTSNGAAEIEIVEGPSCGEVSAISNSIAFHDSKQCAGQTEFKYCLRMDDTCDVATVTIDVKAAPLAVADISVPERNEMVPLPISHKKSTQRSGLNGIIHQPVQINAFVVTLDRSEERKATTNALDGAQELSHYLINTRELNINAEPDNSIAPEITLYTMNVPLDAARSASFLKSHPNTADQDDPARNYDAGVFIARGPTTEDFDSVGNLPEDVTIASDLTLPAPATDTHDIVSMADEKLDQPAAVIAPEPVEVAVATPTVTPIEKADEQTDNEALAFNNTAEFTNTKIASLHVPATLDAPTPDRPTIAFLSPDSPNRAVTNLSEASAQIDAQLPATETLLPKIVPVQTANCAPTADVQAAPGAHLRLNVKAACAAGRNVTVSQKGINFEFTLDANGNLIAEVPALAVDPTLSIQIENGKSIRASAYTDDVLRVKRSVLVTDATEGHQLTAVEFDAISGQDRQLTAANSLSHRKSYELGQGYVRAYAGADNKRIEIYTLPISRRVPGGTVKLNLTRKPGLENCINTAKVDFMHLDKANARLQSANISLGDCGRDYALGDVIGNIRIAAR